ncbi:ABC transporter substrate-binding protein [Arthrobacter sp. AZCC_0090]|uniref:ABC transporter substrate-binding protein n=1 Tax=Arthrobacter sp. AZCC_0090 TaxID=2735881 RepID=UPI0016192EB5|nr:penicillin-binding protein activator [Arthrobacter sp. AZCC_0090]MBB6407198.1 branched-chain amino acid transport system substrate-binding protein [Arthrobacter sp. AZCC_0090]
MKGNNVVSKKLIAALGVLSSLFLTACTGGGAGNAPASGAGGTYNIYASYPVTGALATTAKTVITGLEAAVEDINTSGGFGGRQAKLTIVDDQLDPAKAVTLLQQQIDKAKPDLVLAGVTSNIALALLPLTTRNEILTMTLGQSSKISDPANFPFAFSPTVPNVQDAKAVTTQLLSQGIKKVGMLTANDANGTDTATAYAAAFKAAGIEVVADSYAAADIDMTAPLERLSADDPDGLVMQAFGPAAGYILTGITKLGLGIPVVAGISLSAGNNLGTISSPADWKNLTISAYPINTAKRDESGRLFKSLMAHLKSSGAKLTNGMNQVADGFDMLQIARRGVDQAGAVDAASVSKALENPRPLDGTAPYVRWGTQTFSPESHFLGVSAKDAYVFVKPGPYVDGVIQSIG